MVTNVVLARLTRMKETLEGKAEMPGISPQRRRSALIGYLPNYVSNRACSVLPSMFTISKVES